MEEHICRPTPEEERTAPMQEAYATREETIAPLIDTAVQLADFSHVQQYCYLDHAGAALYSKTHVEAFSDDLTLNLYGNPHSNNMASQQCKDTVDQVRRRILKHFKTTTENYSVIFTSGATAALKIVAESFDFSGVGSGYPSDAHSYPTFLYLTENHTSVIGMREVENISKNRVFVSTINHQDAFKKFNSANCESEPSTSSAASSNSDTKNYSGNSLFVYPAQCNFSGFKYPLSWIEKVQKGVMGDKQQNRAKCKWFCLLDAASFVSSSTLDLSIVQPDFVAISFYKIWGLPTGLGALLVLNQSAYVLKKRYFSGGTVQFASPTGPECVLKTSVIERFEDGTLNFLSICALRHALNWQHHVGFNMDTASIFCFKLAQYTYRGLRSLKHINGRAAVCIYSDTEFDDHNTQGGVVNFNVVRQSGDYVGYQEVMKMASHFNILLRVGCFCNPGACQRFLGITPTQYQANFEAGHVCGDNIDLIDGRPTGSVRVSYGPYSRQEDADQFVGMISDCFVPKHRMPAVNQGLGSSNDDDDVIIIEDSRQSSAGANFLKKRKEPRTDSTVVSHLWIYPIKSCRGIEVDNWQIDCSGLLYDRLWMVVTEADVPLSQKVEPRLCLIKPVIEESRNKLVLNFEGHPSCEVPLELDEEDEQKFLEARTCGEGFVPGIECDRAISEWLDLVLGRKGLKLIRKCVEPHELLSKYRKREENHKHVSFANQAQFLLVNESSVSWLTELLPPNSGCCKSSMLKRFRCNIAIKGPIAALEERKWKDVCIGSLTFQVESECSRCQMICIDQDTAQKTSEPLTTLAANSQGGLKFGVYLRCLDHQDINTISIGDEVSFIMK